MTKKCPLTNDYVLYIACKECEVEYECRKGKIRNEKMEADRDILKIVKAELREKFNTLKEEHNLDWKQELKILSMLSADLAEELGQTASIMLRPKER
jgi:hypothetical protein